MNIVTLRLAYAGTIGAIAFAAVYIFEPQLRLVLSPTVARFVIAVITAMIISIGCKGVEKFPYAIVIWIIDSILAISTPIMGPPGLHKPLIGLGTGLMVEVCFVIFGRKGWSYFLAGGIMCAVTPILILGTSTLLGINEEFVKQVIPKLLVMVSVGFIIGGSGMVLGYFLFNHFLSKVGFISRLKVVES